MSAMKSYLIDMLGLCHVVAIHAKMGRKYIVKELLTYIIVKIIAGQNNLGSSVSMRCFIDVKRTRKITQTFWLLRKSVWALVEFTRTLSRFLNGVLKIFTAEWLLGVIYM